MKAIEQRLVELEQDAPAVAQCYAWASPGETVEDTIVRQFPEGLAENATAIVFQWGAGPPDVGGWSQ